MKKMLQKRKRRPKKKLKSIIKKEERIIIKQIKKAHFFVRNTIDKAIGLRVFKTALAVTLSQLASMLYGSGSYFAGLSAVITLQNTISSTLSSGINRILGTVVGLVVGIIFYNLNLRSTVFLFLGTLLVIKLCILLDWKKAISLSVVIFIILMYFTPSKIFRDVYSFGVLRLVDSAVGVLASIAVNHFIYSPKKEDKEF